MSKKIIIILAISLSLFIVFGIVFLTNINKEKNMEMKIERTEIQMAHPELLIEDIKTGTGSSVKKGDKVEVNYVGTLEDGSVFDSSYDKGRTFTFTVGEQRVIPGWEIGIEGMKTEGKRRLVIPSELGYGESGVRGMIPPNATIIFEIELVGIK